MQLEQPASQLLEQQSVQQLSDTLNTPKILIILNIDKKKVTVLVLLKYSGDISTKNAL
jgi:hypothetical protein